MQVVIRGTLGISALQNLKASPMQAERCSEVPWAKPADDVVTRVARTAVPIRTVRILLTGIPLASWLRGSRCSFVGVTCREPARSSVTGATQIRRCLDRASAILARQGAASMGGPS